MTSERLVACFIVRVVVQWGKRQIRVLDVTDGVTQQFSSYPELIRFMAARETQYAPGDRPERPGGS